MSAPGGALEIPDGFALALLALQVQLLPGEELWFVLPGKAPETHPLRQFVDAPRIRARGPNGAFSEVLLDVVSLENARAVDAYLSMRVGLLLDRVRRAT